MAINTKGKKTTLGEDALIYEKREEDDITGRQHWKNLSGKKRLTQFKDYYLPTIAVIVFVLCFAGYIIYHDVINRKDVIYQAAIFNEILPEESVQTFSSEFVTYSGHDTEEEKAAIGTFFNNPETASEANASVANDIQHIASLVISGMLDVIIADDNTIQNYKNENILWDLDDFLTNEEKSKLKPFYYSINNDSESGSYGLNLNYSSRYSHLFSQYKQHTQTPILAIIKNSENKELTRQLIYYLFPDVFTTP
ncbi:MAG: hypothetical protein LBR68_07440 [Lachnoclostridium sp.]|nr:hypothetical protein [Lachnoclostridium sp.]